MYLLAHLALAAAVGLLVQRTRPGATGRLRWWMVGGILPDLIDKPLALIVPAMAGYGRGLGHTALFVVILMAVGVRFLAFRGLAGGAATHLLLDLPWTYAASFAWPLLGMPLAGKGQLGVDGYLRIMMNQEVIIGELVGAAVLFVFAARHLSHRLPRRAPAVASLQLVVLPRREQGSSAARRTDGVDDPSFRH